MKRSAMAEACAAVSTFVLSRSRETDWRAGKNLQQHRVHSHIALASGTAAHAMLRGEVCQVLELLYHDLVGLHQFRGRLGSAPVVRQRAVSIELSGRCHRLLPSWPILLVFI